MFKNRSIKGKLIGMQLVTAATVLILCVIGFMLFNVQMLKDVTSANLVSTAQVISINSAVTLTFLDPEAGVEVLQGLRAEDNITDAYLLDIDGNNELTIYLAPVGKV